MASKVNPESKRSSFANLGKQIADHQARIQVIASNWSEEIQNELNASEKEFLKRLKKELDGFEFNKNAAETLKRLDKIYRKLVEIRENAYERAREKIEAEAVELSENETKWAKRITKEVSEKGTSFKDVSAAKIARIVKYGLAKGLTIQQYFTQMALDDAIRIESAVNQGLESGWSIDQIARNIAGTEENDYKDGIFETSRRSAVNMARTLCNAFSNNAKEAFYNENDDVITGVEILSTLDGRTCPVCASLDRTRYKNGESHPSLPIHHQCRCVLLPVTPLSDFVEEERPMANADFNAEAKRLYEKKYPKKNFDDLADSTKKKYYYEAMSEYERKTGKPAYTQVSGSVSFKEYLTKYMSEEQRKDWLGPELYKLWKKGRLPLDKFIPPYPNKRLTVKELKRLDQESFNK